MTTIPIPVTTLDRIEVLELDKQQRGHLEALTALNGILIEVECNEVKYHAEATIRAIITYPNGEKLSIHYPHSFYTEDAAKQSPIWQAIPHMKGIEKILRDYITRKSTQKQ